MIKSLFTIAHMNIRILYNLQLLFQSIISYKFYIHFISILNLNHRAELSNKENLKLTNILNVMQKLQSVQTNKIQKLYHPRMYLKQKTTTRAISKQC